MTKNRSSARITDAATQESKAFTQAYLWLEEHMPPNFLKEIGPEEKHIIARNLLSFCLQENYEQVRLKHLSIAMCLDGPDADLKILKKHTHHTIRYYRAFVSNAPPPGHKTGKLRVALIYIRSPTPKEPLPKQEKALLSTLIREINPKASSKEIAQYISEFSYRFVRSMTRHRLKSALRLFLQAKDQDQCQFEVRHNPKWKEENTPSMQLIIAWKSVPKAGFLYHLAKVIYFHNLALKRMVANYIHPNQADNVVILSLGLHGIDGKSAKQATDIDDFLREFCLTKFFETEDLVSATFVHQKLLSGNEGHLVRNLISLTHQFLTYADPHLYSLENVIDGFCHHPDLTIRLCHLFRNRFHPKQKNTPRYQEEKQTFLELLKKLDTGQASNDLRRRLILRQGLTFIDQTLKTNFYQHNKSSFSFRIDPNYLSSLPYDTQEFFPEIPFAIFFVRGMHFIGFSIRFKDLARGGMRTVIPLKRDQFLHERNHLFQEAYHLAYTQQKKNKDIPEGGAKTVILLRPPDHFLPEESIYCKELQEDGVKTQTIQHLLEEYRKEEQRIYKEASQRCFIASLLTLVNCDSKGALKEKSIIDYWKKPEYLYMGPDENISNEMLTWIADYAMQSGYLPGRSFISSKPRLGINHKRYGITSYGVHVYLEEVLRFLNIQPSKASFTIKISGGPDGDVAGNEIYYLNKYYPKTAKIVAITDVSGTIFDPKGLHLNELVKLFHEGKPLRFYPPQKLASGGYLLDLTTQKSKGTYVKETLLWVKEKQLKKRWLQGNETNHLYRHNVHQAKADIFIPAGGRPRTLNEGNYHHFLDEKGTPTSKAIIEGANLYLTPQARAALEKKGVLILKDSSCNKGGVICSSFEVLANLLFKDTEFLKHKETLVQEILMIIRLLCQMEARVLLNAHKATQIPLTTLSEKVSEKINFYKYQILDALAQETLPLKTSDPLLQSLIHYCPSFIQRRYQKRILALPDLHKKAIIACYIASRLIYARGIDWTPSIQDILPLITPKEDS